MSRFGFKRYNAASVASSLLVLALIFAFSATAYAKDPQLVPLRLSSIGGSITLGSDAEHLGQNHNASWVNGYFGFWEWMRGLTDVNSHNQRITANWGSTGRTNYTNAVGGAEMSDFRRQARLAVRQKAQYVTVLIGHSDLCQIHLWEIPSDTEFEDNFRAGLEKLRSGLPDGATVYVLSLLDLEHLFETARFKKALGKVECEKVWSLDRFPCSTMLNPDLTDAQREYTRNRNISFNEILERVTSQYQADDPHHHYYFTNIMFYYPFIESDVSDIDCFHPSAQGQKKLSEMSWNAGPFRAFQKRN